MNQHLSLVTLLALFAVVAFGAVIPVVPTGAAVSSAAVLAGHTHVYLLVVVVAVGGFGAYVGDVTTYVVLTRAGEPLARRVGWLKEHEDDDHLVKLRTAIEKHEQRTLLVSRLVPGGRVPVLLVAALTHYPRSRFVSAAALAAVLWAAVYAAVGLLGTSVFPSTRDALVVAIGGALALSVLLQLVQRLRKKG